MAAESSSSVVANYDEVVNRIDDKAKVLDLLFCVFPCSSSISMAGLRARPSKIGGSQQDQAAVLGLLSV